MKISAIVALLLVGATCCWATSEQEQLLDKLLSAEMALSPSETAQLLEKLDKNHSIGGQFRVSKLLSFQDGGCDKEALLALTSAARTAGFLYKQRNSLVDYLADCERSRYLKCGRNLALLGNPSDSLNLAELENIDELLRRLAKIPARELLNAAFAKEEFLAECHKAHNLLEPFYLVHKGAKKYHLEQVLLDGQLKKWSKIFENCDKVLYLANPYDLRWTSD